MLHNKLFIENELPILNKEDIIEYTKRARNGDKKARDILIMSNIRLVFKQVTTTFSTIPYTYKDDLVSIGIIGLIKSVDTYNIDKNIKFSTYAVSCINNEIFMFLRNLKKYSKEESLNQTILGNMDGKELKLEDKLEDESQRIIFNYEKKELALEIKRQIDSMDNGRNNKIIKLYFGFEDNIQYSSSEIAQKLGISRATVRYAINKTLKSIKKNIVKKGLIEGEVQKQPQVKRLYLKRIDS